MKAQELRIGNIVDFEGQTETVYQINNSGVDFFRGTTKKGVIIQSYVWEAVKPILLTKEWLVKFGFIKSTGWDEFEYFYNNGVHIYICSDTINEWFEYEMDFKVTSVHQLQNLYFALTQEELC